MKTLKHLNTQKRLTGLVIMEGFTVRTLARQVGFSETWVSLVLNSRVRSWRAREAIARAIGKNVFEMWPDTIIPKKRKKAA